MLVRAFLGPGRAAAAGEQRRRAERRREGGAAPARPEAVGSVRPSDGRDSNFTT